MSVNQISKGFSRTRNLSEKLLNCAQVEMAGWCGRQYVFHFRFDEMESSSAKQGRLAVEVTRCPGSKWVLALQKKKKKN